MAWWNSSSWDRLGRLNRAERVLLAQALIVLPLTAVGLRLLGLPRWQALVERFTPRRAPGPDAESVIRCIRAAAYHGPFPASCLVRCCAAWWLLRRRGIDCKLRIGVRKEAGALLAHAWLERQGQVWTDAPDLPYQALKPA